MCTTHGPFLPLLAISFIKKALPLHTSSQWTKAQGETKPEAIYSEYFSMIDVRIELSPVPGGWKQVACDVRQPGEQIPVLEVPAREEEVFPSADIALTTLKDRVAFELQQNHVHESGDSVKWQIKIHFSQPER